MGSFSLFLPFPPSPSPLQGHTQEIVLLQFNQRGTKLFTASFDHTLAVWDARTGRRLRNFIGHRAEIASFDLNFEGTHLLTSALDHKCHVWDVATGSVIHTLKCVLPWPPSSLRRQLLARRPADQPYPAPARITAHPPFLKGAQG